MKKTFYVKVFYLGVGDYRWLGGPDLKALGIYTLSRRKFVGRCGSHWLPCLHVTFPGDSQVAGVGDETRRRAIRQHVLPASVTFSDKQPTNPPFGFPGPDCLWRVSKTLHAKNNPFIAWPDESSSQESLPDLLTAISPDALFLTGSGKTHAKGIADGCELQVMLREGGWALVLGLWWLKSILKFF